MRKHVLAVAAIGAITLAPVAGHAQSSGVEEIVVTASKREYDAQSTPAVILRKRADNLITRVTIICDTRDESQRRAELKTTLRNLIKAAGADPRIALSVGEEVIGDFDETMLDKVIEPGGRAETSSATLIIKTDIAPADTFDAATGRIEAFAERTAKAGRTEILLDDDWELTLVGPGQYRSQVAQLVAADATRLATIFGDGYGVQVEGLQLPVSWYQAGALELALYIPYRLTIRPKSP